MLSDVVFSFLMGCTITLVFSKAHGKSSSNYDTLTTFKERGLFDMFARFDDDITHDGDTKTNVLSPEDERKRVYTLNACNHDKFTAKVDSIHESSDSSKGCFSIYNYFGVNKPCYDMRYISNGIRFTVTQGQTLIANTIIMENSTALDSCIQLTARNSEVTFCLTLKNMLWTKKGFKGCLYTHVEFLIRSQKRIRIHCVELRKGTSTSSVPFLQKTDTAMNNTALNWSHSSQEPLILKVPPLFVGVLDLDCPRFKVGNTTREKLQESEEKFIGMGKHLIYLPYKQESNIFSPTFPTMSISRLNHYTNINKFKPYEGSQSCLDPNSKNTVEPKQETSYLKMSKALNNKAPVFILQLPTKVTNEDDYDYEYNEAMPDTEIKNDIGSRIATGNKRYETNNDLPTAVVRHNITNNLLTTVQEKNTKTNQSKVLMTKRNIPETPIISDYLINTPLTQSAFDNESSFLPTHLMNYKEYLTPDSIVSYKIIATKRLKKPVNLLTTAGNNSLSNYSLDLGQTNTNSGQSNQPAFSQESLLKEVEADSDLPNSQIYKGHTFDNSGILKKPGLNLSLVKTGSTSNFKHLLNHLEQPIDTTFTSDIVSENTSEKNKQSVYPLLTHITDSSETLLSNPHHVQQKKDQLTHKHVPINQQVIRTHLHPHKSNTFSKIDNVQPQQLEFIGNTKENAISGENVSYNKIVPQHYSKPDNTLDFSSAKSERNYLPHLNKQKQQSIAKPNTKISFENQNSINKDRQPDYTSFFPPPLNDNSPSQPLKKWSEKYKHPKETPINKANVYYEKNPPKTFRQNIDPSSSSKTSKSRKIYPLWPIQSWQLRGTPDMYVSPHIRDKKFPRHPGHFPLSFFGYNHQPYWTTHAELPIKSQIVGGILHPAQKVGISPQTYRQLEYLPGYPSKASLNSRPTHSWQPMESFTIFNNGDKRLKKPNTVPRTNSKYTFRPEQIISKFLSFPVKTGSKSKLSIWPKLPLKQKEYLTRSRQLNYPYLPVENDRAYWSQMEEQINYPFESQHGYQEENPSNTNYPITTPEDTSAYLNNFPGYNINSPLLVQPTHSQEGVPDTKSENTYTPMQIELRNKALTYGRGSKPSLGSHIDERYSKVREGFNYDVSNLNYPTYPNQYSMIIPSLPHISILPGYNPRLPHINHPLNSIPPNIPGQSGNPFMVGSSNIYTNNAPNYEIHSMEVKDLSISPPYSIVDENIPGVTSTEARSSTFPIQSEYSSYPNTHLAETVSSKKIHNFYQNGISEHPKLRHSLYHRW